MQTDFAANIYAAGEATPVLRGKRKAEPGRQHGYLLCSGPRLGYVQPHTGGVAARGCWGGLSLRLIWNAHSIPARCIPLQETQERQEK